VAYPTIKILLSNIWLLLSRGDPPPTASSGGINPGPPSVALMLQRSAAPGDGFALSLQTAAGSLVVGIALFGWLARRHPIK